MKTILLEKIDYNSLSVSVDGDVKVLNITGYRVGGTQGGCTLHVVTPGFVYSVDIDTTDDVSISGSVFSGTKAQLETAVNALMLSNPSGGSGGGGTVLQSPDNTLWLIGVNDSGALQTTQVASGTPGTLSLFSPDNTEWNVTVNNSGALTTTAV